MTSGYFTELQLTRLQCVFTSPRWRAGGSPYVCCCGDWSLINNLWRDILRRAVFAVVLLGSLQFYGVAEVANADQVTAGARH